MKRLIVLTLALLTALSLSGCKKAEEEAPDLSAPVSAAPAEVETPTDSFITVTGDAFEPATNIASVSASAIVTEGRVPEGEYDLPGSVVRQNEFAANGGIALLEEVEEADAAFYAVEGKESCPALIRWGDSLAEFDWTYLSPQTVEPQMWCFDYDGDGADELAVECFAGGDTGVSLFELHIIEKNGDGTLTAYTFPRETLAAALDGCLQIVSNGKWTYVNLGQTLVIITHELGDLQPRYQNNGVDIGPSISFRRTTDRGFDCDMGVMLEAEDIFLRYVATLSASVYYKDGSFILDCLHL